MFKVNLKMTLIFLGLLFLLMASVSAAENSTDEVAGDAELPQAVEAPAEDAVIADDDGQSLSEAQSNSTEPAPAPVVKKAVKIKAKSVSGKQGKKVKISAVFKTQDSKALKYKKVTFKVNGKTYKTKTDGKGKASIKIKLAKAKCKTVKSKKGKILTVKKIYKSVRNCKISFEGTDTLASCTKNVKVTSKKKTVVKKYRYHKYRTKTVPFKKGYHEYVRGPVRILTNDAVTGDVHVIGIVAGYKNAETTFKISTKLKTLYPDGKYHWDNAWEPCTEEDGIYGVIYYHNMDKVSKIKIRYHSPYYERIK